MVSSMVSQSPSDAATMMPSPGESNPPIPNDSGRQSIEVGDRVVVLKGTYKGSKGSITRFTPYFAYVKYDTRHISTGKKEGRSALKSILKIGDAPSSKDEGRGSETTKKRDSLLDVLHKVRISLGWSKEEAEADCALVAVLLEITKSTT